MVVMSDFNEAEHPRQKTGRFTDKQNGAPEVGLSESDTGRAGAGDKNLAGSYLSGADLCGADLRNANLIGANLRNANLAGAVADVGTIWPDGFDPVARGVIVHVPRTWSS